MVLPTAPPASLSVSQILTEFGIAAGTQKRLSNDLFPLVNGTAGATCSLAASFSGKSAAVPQKFVAVAALSGTCASSADGITWTSRNLPSSGAWSSVTVNPTTGLFVAIAQTSSIAASSTDGITWTQRALPTSAYWFTVTGF